MKNFFVIILAGVGVYAILEWYRNSPHSPGGKNPVVQEVSGIAPDTNYTASNEMTSGVPVFNDAPVANGHGDQVAAAYHANRFATLPGSAQYEPAFGPHTNGGGGVTNGRL
jgi:hypothetical protein